MGKSLFTKHSYRKKKALRDELAKQIIAEHNIRYIILGSKDSFFEYIVSLEENAVDFIFAKHKNKFNFDFFYEFFK